MPTSSVEAVQFKSAVVLVILDAIKFVGAVGACVSATVFHLSSAVGPPQILVAK